TTVFAAACAMVASSRSRPIQMLPSRSASGAWNSATSGLIAGSSTIGSSSLNGLSTTFQSLRRASTSEPISPRSGMKGTPFSAAWNAAWSAGQVASLTRIAPDVTAAVKRGARPNSPRLTAEVSMVSTQPAPMSKSACRLEVGSAIRCSLRMPRRTSARVAAMATPDISRGTASTQPSVITAKASSSERAIMVEAYHRPSHELGALPLPVRTGRGNGPSRPQHRRPTLLGSGRGLLDPVGRERHGADAHAGGVEDRVGDRRRHRTDRGLAGAGGRQLGMVDRHHLDRFRSLGDVEDRIGHPVDAGHVLSVELDFLPERAAHALHDVALDGVLEPIGVDDLPAVMGNGELACPDLSARAVDIDLGHDRAAGAVALGIGDAAAGHLVAGLVLARRGPRLPSGFFGGGLDHRDVARVLDVTQAELDGIEVERRRHLVHERLAGEMDLRSNRIAQMRAAQRRAALEQRRNGLPRHALVGELVGLGRDAEAVGGFELGAAQLARQRVLGRAAVGVHVDARETFAGEL